MTDNKPTCKTCDYWKNVSMVSGYEVTVCKPSNWVYTIAEYSCRNHKPRGEHPQFSKDTSHE